MAGSIIPPSMAGNQGDPIVATYMGPFREKGGEHRMVVSIISGVSGRMIAHADVIVASRDSGIALAEMLKAVVTKEVPPPIHEAN